MGIGVWGRGFGAFQTSGSLSLGTYNSDGMSSTTNSIAAASAGFFLFKR